MIKHAVENKLHKKDTGHAVTHCRLDGGVYCYDTDELLDTFFELYAQDLDGGIRHYCHENRSQMFPMFFDLDILLKTRVDELKLFEWAKVIYDGVRAFMKSRMKLEHDACIIAVAPFAEKEGHVKAGIHLHFPELIVDLKWGVEITGAIVKFVTDKIGIPTEFVNPWYPKVIDIEPISRGLRMIGSRKADPCKECRKNTKDKENAEPCNVLGCIRGHIDKGRPYWPRWIIGNSAPKYEFLLTDYKELVKLCSTRIPISRHFSPAEITKIFLVRPNWWKQQRDLPEIIGMENYNKLIKGNDSRKLSGVKRKLILSNQMAKQLGTAADGNDPSNDGSVMHGVVDRSDDDDFIKVNQDDSAYTVIEEFFNGSKLSRYKQQKTFHVLKDGKVTGVSRNKASTVYFVWTNSRQCRNLVPNANMSPRQHSSRTVWIKITQRGIEWNCHCKCDTTENRINGIPCAKPGLWSRSNVEEYKEMIYLPAELGSLFKNHGHAFAEVDRVTTLTKRGAMQTTVHERLQIINPVVDDLQVSLEQWKRAREKELA